MCPANSVRNLIRERPVVHVRCSRDTKELAQRSRLRVDSMSQYGVADTLEPLDLGVARDQVVQRWLDQR